MTSREFTASEFKAKCLGILDDVAATGAEVVVTKRGRPVARVLPAEQPPKLRGSVTFLVSDDELIAPVIEPWDADAGLLLRDTDA